MAENLVYRLHGRQIVRHGDGNAETIFESDRVSEVEEVFAGLTLPQLVRDVRAFHEKFVLPLPTKPQQLDDELMAFRIQFIHEEAAEYEMAAATEDLHEQLDALVDLVYVVIGTALMSGFDFEEAWRRVHRANMRKVKPASADESKRGHALDVVKPPGWVAPDLSDLVK